MVHTSNIRIANQNQRWMVRFNQAVTRPLILLTLLVSTLSITSSVNASSFGAGNFGANVPFGTQTSIAASLSSNLTLNLTPNGSNFSATGSSVVTVTSSDVNGYDLYVYCPGSSSLVNGSYSIPATANTTEAALQLNTWGYNTDGSSNYIGMTTTPVLIASLSNPYISGNATTVTYGVLTGIATPAGSYSAPVTYTAVALTD